MRRIDESVVEEIKERIVSEFGPEQIFLFGSKAWNDHDPEGDLDLLIVVSTSDERPARRAARACRCLRGIPIEMDFLVRTRAEMDRALPAGTSLESEIVERGRMLYDGRGETTIGPKLAS